jgi:hypothetical protein
MTSRAGYKIEVKLSKLNVPSKAAPSTKRWTWAKPLGWLDKAKTYDYLILLGEKDVRYEEQYLDDSPYIAFLVPFKNVFSVREGLIWAPPGSQMTSARE